MALETVPSSTQSDGKWRIWNVASGVNALSVAIINAGSSLTYSFTPDGFNYTINQETVNDPRLTLVQNLSRPGKKTETLEVKYVRSTTAGSADVILTEGTEGQLVIRRGVDNATVATVAQKADVITYIAGAKRPDAPTENGIDTISQTLFITDVTVYQGTLVA
jgi:hypothetical protein